MKLKSVKDSSDISAIKNLLLKSISMIVGFLYTPMLLNFLGDEAYGVWATILSIINWVNNCDVGIGNGMRNLLSRELALKNYEKAKKIVSTAIVALFCIAAALLICMLFCSNVINWNQVLNTRVDATKAINISVIFMCLNFALGICNSVFHALQKSEIVSFENVAIQVLNFIGLLLLKNAQQDRIVLVAILFGVSTLFVHGVAVWYLFVSQKNVAPGKFEFSKHVFKDIISIGLKFFAAQVAAVILFTTDNVLVSVFFGAANVTPFSLADKVFNSGYLCFAAITVPFWSRTTSDFAQKKYDIIRNNFRKLHFVASLFTCGCIFVALFFEPLTRLWLKNEVAFSTELVVVMCIYYSIYSFSNVSSTFVNGLGGVNGVMILGIVQAVLNIPLSIVFAEGIGLGVVGIRLGTLVVLLIGEVFQVAYYHQIMRKGEGFEAKGSDNAYI